MLRTEISVGFTRIHESDDRLHDSNFFMPTLPIIHFGTIFPNERSNSLRDIVL